MKFLVDDAVAGGHPLYVARVDFSADAAGIAIFQFALIRDGDGFKSFVRMAADAAFFVAGREFIRRGVIEQQKRTQLAAKDRCNQTRSARESCCHFNAIRAALEILCCLGEHNRQYDLR